MLAILVTKFVTRDRCALGQEVESQSEIHVAARVERPSTLSRNDQR